MSLAVKVLYSQVESPLSDEKWESLISQLPPFIQNDIMRIRPWRNRHLSLFGKLLLQEGLRSFGVNPEVLSSMSYADQQRPYLPEIDIDFNISHSGNFVGCALVRNARIGFDIEKVRQFDYERLDFVMSEVQWAEIRTSTNPLHTFFSYWSIKESAIKADGRGVGIPLDKILFDQDRLWIEGRLWHLKQLEIHPDYKACLASERPITNVNMRSVRIL